MFVRQMRIGSVGLAAYRGGTVEAGIDCPLPYPDTVSAKDGNAVRVADSMTGRTRAR